MVNLLLRSHHLASENRLFKRFFCIHLLECIDYLHCKQEVIHLIQPQFLQW